MVPRVASKECQQFLARTRLPFSTINRRGNLGYQADVQKHHLLPTALERKFEIVPRLSDGKRHHVDLHDFRINGVLLPATEKAAQRSKLPLHRGPHPAYSQMVEARLAVIETNWEAHRTSRPISAAQERVLRIDLLLRALRKKLLTASRGKAMLNRKCPLGAGKDFSELDDMAEMLWQVTDNIPDIELAA